MGSLVYPSSRRS